MANLVRTYENHSGATGRFESKGNGREYALIPVFHTTQTAHIEVHISLDGEFRWAEVVDKREASTIIPCTEDSLSRTSRHVPHPLFDKLIYVAGDYRRYVGQPKGTPYEDYLAQLRAWCESPGAHPKVRSVYAYVRKGTLMTDLIGERVLSVDKHGKWLSKWPAVMGEKPRLFKVLAGTQNQEDAFVRFAVDVPGEPASRLWRDPLVHASFIQYYEQTLTAKDLCYVTGEVRPLADKHASGIRYAGDKAKLISANDTGGFTFRGRFRNSRETVIVSAEASQKAHNALKWLIEKQGAVAVDGRIFLVWGTEQLEWPDPFGDSLDLYRNDEDVVGDGTHREFAGQIRKALDGYRYQSDYHSRVIIMVLDAATTGRLSIVYYRDFERDPFLERLKTWHESCSWLHHYRKKGNQPVSFWGAPATKDIAFAAYGPHVSDKVVKGLLERMLPCIVDDEPVPLDIVRSAVNRASSPMGVETWEWEKTLSIACALVKKTCKWEGDGVAVDEGNVNRDYLFGRLLAIADVLERWASHEDRASNAVRYMNAFARYPARTWGIIQANIQPYQVKMGDKAIYFNRLIDHVGSMLKSEDFTNQPLSSQYLLGFYSQRHELYTKKDKKGDAADIGDEPNTEEEM